MIDFLHLPSLLNNWKIIFRLFRMRINFITSAARDGTGGVGEFTRFGGHCCSRGGLAPIGFDGSASGLVFMP